MPAVLLVRHGQASFGAKDYDVLSPLGHRQAEILAERLVALPVVPDRAVTGSLRRQIDTAAPLAARADVMSSRDPRFDEYDHEALVAAAVSAAPGELFGAETPRDLASHLAASPDPERAFQEVLEVSLARWVAGTDDGHTETYDGFRARVRAGLDEVVAAGGAATTVVVTSGGVIAALAADALGLDPAGWARLNTVIVNTSVTRLVIGRRGTTMVALNDHAHLEADPALVTYR